MILLRQAPQALLFGIIILLSSLQTVVSAANAQLLDQPRQVPRLKGARGIGDYVAKGLGFEPVDKSGLENVASPASGVGVPTNGYNASTTVSSAKSVSSSESESESSTTTAFPPEPPVSANGTINSQALSCYSARYTWREEYEAWWSTAISGKSFSRTQTISELPLQFTTTATIYPTSVSTYKLCDGSPRVDAVPITLTSTYNWTSTFTEYVTLGTPTFAPAPCSISPQGCSYLYYNTNLTSEDDVLEGACGFPAHLGQPCLIGGGPVRLAYFPVTTTNGDLCNGNGSTVTSMGGPSTVEALGTTFTSGSAYLSFQTLFAYQDGFNDRIGPTFTDFILAIPSDAVSTQCGGFVSAQGPGTSLNFADLNYPIPASAYACENRCTTELVYTNINHTVHKYTPPPECYTIWEDFSPALAVPIQARDLVPEWSTCSFWDAVLPNFLFDPPIALHPATAVATATLPVSDPQATTPATPASTSYTALPETASPVPNTPGTTTSDPGATVDPTSDPGAGGNPTPPAGTTTQGVMIEFSAGTQMYTASAAVGPLAHNAFVVNGVTLPLGGAAQVVDGHTVSVGLGGFAVDGSSAAEVYSSSVGAVVATPGLSSPSGDDGGSGSGSGESGNGGDSSGGSSTGDGGSGNNSESSEGDSSGNGGSDGGDSASGSSGSSSNSAGDGSSGSSAGSGGSSGGSGGSSGGSGGSNGDSNGSSGSNAGSGSSGSDGSGSVISGDDTNSNNPTNPQTTSTAASDTTPSSATTSDSTTITTTSNTETSPPSKSTNSKTSSSNSTPSSSSTTRTSAATPARENLISRLLAPAAVVAGILALALL